MRIASTIPPGADVSSSLQEFIAKANAIQVDVEAWSARPEQEANARAAAAIERAEAAERALGAERERMAKGLDASSARVGELEIKLADALARAQAAAANPTVVVDDEAMSAMKTRVSELEAMLRTARSRAESAETRAARAEALAEQSHGGVIDADILRHESAATRAGTRRPWGIAAAAFAGGLGLMLAGLWFVMPTAPAPTYAAPALPTPDAQPAAVMQPTAAAQPYVQPRAAAIAPQVTPQPAEPGSRRQRSRSRKSSGRPGIVDPFAAPHDGKPDGKTTEKGGIVDPFAS